MHTLNRILQAGKLVPALEQALHARKRYTAWQMNRSSGLSGRARGTI